MMGNAARPYMGVARKAGQRRGLSCSLPAVTVFVRPESLLQLRRFLQKFMIRDLRTCIKQGSHKLWLLGSFALAVEP